jgi:NADH-quinone oxidoreductase subunit I
MKVSRRKMTLLERIYLWEILRGLGVTLRQFVSRKVTQQYPEEKHEYPEDYRGVPVLVSDQDGRMKCVACQLCEFVCPPEAIKITADELPAESNVEKYPARFDLNMLRCIFCGMCEEACPEEAIFMSRIPIFTVESRDEAILDRDQLLRLGGSREDTIMKWASK